MNLVCEKEGIVHFWDLPQTNHVVLQPKFKDELMRTFIKNTGSLYKANKLSGISRTTIRRYSSGKEQRVRIDFLLKIASSVNDKRFDLNNLEKNIVWIGNYKSPGINRPKLPFNFCSREGARFMAAICNDGWISDGVYYSNLDNTLRDSVKKDALTVFGGNREAITDSVKANDKFLRFPSIVRDTLILITGFKGVKSENNPSVPEFILSDENLMCGWIEQTIADEGCVKHYPQTYRREVTWKRAFKLELEEYKLHIAEKIMLDKLGIKYEAYNTETYKTHNGVTKRNILMRLAKRENLLKLRSLVKIPSERKDKILTEIANNYQRYKEPLLVMNSIIKICKRKGSITSYDLAKEMNYKNVGNATRWLKFYARQKALNCLEESTYGEARGRVPAKYSVIRTQRI